MSWITSGADRVEATAYTRDYSASSVFDELKENGGADFGTTPEYIVAYGSDSWKVYKITIVIEPAPEI